MKHIAIKKTTADKMLTLLIENYLSDEGVVLWRMCYRYNYSTASLYNTFKDGLMNKPNARQTRAFYAHFI